LLGTARARYRFVKILDQVRCSQQFQLIGYVVMPEHVHLLISEPRTTDPSKSLQVLKQRVSRGLRGRRRGTPSQQLSLPFRSFAALPMFWQRRFYDFNVWSAKKLAAKLDYIHRNPMQRKLVTHPRDWPWSSWSHFVRATCRRKGVNQPDRSATCQIAPDVLSSKGHSTDVHATECRQIFRIAPPK
jgi:putative transposase